VTEVMLVADERLLDRITIDPDVMVGKPTIRGMRITVEQIIVALAAGVTEAELIADYPQLEPEDLRAALAYAAQLLAEQRVYRVG
jgi:uncharacterized protein (DUF433 family)